MLTCTRYLKTGPAQKQLMQVKRLTNLKID